MKRTSLGILLVLHGMAHSAAGTWASSMGRPWLSTILWAVAALSFLGAGFGLLGVPPLGRQWRVLTMTGGLFSLTLLLVYASNAFIPGILLDVAFIYIALRVDIASPALPHGHHPARHVMAGIGHAAAWALIAYAGLVIVTRPWYTTWGTTRVERAAPVPGDYLGDHGHYRVDHAVTIAAPADSVWPWLVQLGQDRAGFYSYDKLERLIGDDVHNVDSIVPAWQQREVGDFVRAAQPGYLGWLLDQDIGWRVTELEPGRYMVLENWGAFIVEPVDSTTSRLLVRTRGSGYPSPLATVLGPLGLLVFEPAHFIMERKMMLRIKELAETRRVTTAPTDYLGSR